MGATMWRMTCMRYAQKRRTAMVALLLENNGGLGCSHFRTLPYRFEMQEICRHHGKFQPQLEAKYKHVVLSETGVCPKIVLINGKMIINHWLDFEVPSFQTNHDKPMFENIFSLWMDSLATCFFSLGQGFNGCHTKRSKLIAVQSKEACASTATGVLEAHH